MNTFKSFSRKNTAKIPRVFVIAVTIFSLVAGSFPAAANAAVPTWVVNFDANTAFETSLETFMFDLFNTLQRRQEDFTAAFELQKIEKAREDVNKLFQETQEELQNFGLALNETKPAGDGPVRDPKLNAGQNNDNCNNGLYSGNNSGCPPVISSLKDSRIIHDPYQYLFGDAYTKGQLYAYCYFDYLIWDQAGLLSQIYNFLQPIPRYSQKKATYALDPSAPNANQESIEWLIQSRNSVVVALHRSNYYLLNYPLHNIYGLVGRTGPTSFDINIVRETENKCRQVMYAVGGENIVSLQQNADFLKELNQRNGVANPTDAELYATLSFLPTLERGISNRAPGDGYTFAQAQKITDKRNSRPGVMERMSENLARIIEETKEERNATYIAGQGFRPEYLYTSQTGAKLKDKPCSDPTSSECLIASSSFLLNTEYIISPAAVLLQKMQAASQAMFDLAGQGFLYLSPDNTPSNILQSYNLASTATQSAERRICNQAGSCALLDPWLKPTASFRSAAVLETNTSGTKSPRLIGTFPDYAIAKPYKPAAGSGLPAPWEDPGDYLNISNEKVASPTGGLNDLRYTIARYRLQNVTPQESVRGEVGKNTAGRDEFDIDPLLRSNFRDNIGRTIPGADYPANDWYDRVLEMYEAGIGVSDAGNSERPAQNRDFTVRDWQCYIATWFFRQNAHQGQNANFFVGESGIATDQSSLLSKYCGT